MNIGTKFNFHFFDNHVIYNLYPSQSNAIHLIVQGLSLSLLKTKKTKTKMSSNVGLTTPRGSGTSGYVQRNLSYLRPRDSNNTSSSYHPESSQDSRYSHQQRQPDQQILNHDRLREVEVKVFELRDRLEDEGWVLFFVPLIFFKGVWGRERAFAASRKIHI